MGMQFEETLGREQETKTSTMSRFVILLAIVAISSYGAAAPAAAPSNLPVVPFAPAPAFPEEVPVLGGYRVHTKRAADSVPNAQYRYADGGILGYAAGYPHIYLI